MELLTGFANIGDAVVGRSAQQFCRMTLYCPQCSNAVVEGASRCGNCSAKFTTPGGWRPVLQAEETTIRVGPWVKSSIAGGIWFWVLSLTGDGSQGKAAVLAQVFFFLFIPAAALLSALVSLLSIIPLWWLLRRTTFGKPPLFAGVVVLLTTSLVGLALANKSLTWSNFLREVWPLAGWLGLMALVLSVLLSRERVHADG